MVKEKPDKLLPAPVDIEAQAKIFVEKGIPGDSINNAAPTRNMIKQKNYAKVTQIGTYAEYMHRKFRGFVPAVGEAMIRASDKDLVDRYDKKVAEINAEIGAGVVGDEQADRVLAKIAELADIIYGRA